VIRFDFVITRRKVKDSVFPIFPIFAGFRLRSAACARSTNRSAPRRALTATPLAKRPTFQYPRRFHSRLSALGAARRGVGGLRETAEK